MYDWDKTSDHDLIGCFTTNFNQLKAAYEDKGRKFEVINKKKEAKKKSYNNSGLVSVKCLAVCKRYTFCQYLQVTYLNFENLLCDEIFKRHVFEIYIGHLIMNDKNLSPTSQFCTNHELPGWHQDELFGSY